MGALLGAAPSGRRRVPLVVVGAAVPLAVAGLAYLSWWISDRLVYVGPLDRTAFGWIVVAPIWIAAPVAAGFAWRALDQRTTWAVAAFVGAVIAAVAGLLLWQAVAFPACETGAIRSAQEMALPSLLAGVAVGGGVALSGLVSAHSARQGRFVSAVVLGATCEALMMAAAIVVAVTLLLGPACQRPSI
jgi:hypothetical protein